jgi:hypothetical protein
MTCQDIHPQGSWDRRAHGERRQAFLPLNVLLVSKEKLISAANWRVQGMSSGEML